MKRSVLLLSLLLFFAALKLVAQRPPIVVPVAAGWAGNSVNTVVFRKNSLVSLGNEQYIAWYNNDGYVVLGKRVLPGGKWQIKTTQYKGYTNDAHNSICIMVDGDGFLHLAWDHHNNALRYCKSISPGSLEMTEKLSMTGSLEEKVTYPEFHRLPNGHPLFLYRNGQSGEGNLIINTYNTQTTTWTQLHSNLIDGEGQRNAYWQACTDEQGNFHISWVWRETGDVASNHDLCYARSADGGNTWVKSTGEKYALPINAGNAEYLCRIPQQSELINQTAMYADGKGHPFIASYWRESGDSVPQYHVVYKIQQDWIVRNLSFRKKPFTLSGGDTKRIPISRPQIIAWQNGQHTSAALIFRDETRGSKVSAAVTPDISSNKWTVKDLTQASIGSWEPTYDTEWWKQKKELHLFLQFTDQKDGEGKSAIAPQMVSVLQWNPLIK